MTSTAPSEAPTADTRTKSPCGICGPRGHLMTTTATAPPDVPADAPRTVFRLPLPWTMEVLSVREAATPPDVVVEGRAMLAGVEVTRTAIVLPGNTDPAGDAYALALADVLAVRVARQIARA